MVLVFHFPSGVFITGIQIFDMIVFCFIFSDPYYLAPECFALDLTYKALIAASNSPHESEIIDSANAKSCVWSFGIILLELCLVRLFSLARKINLSETSLESTII
jgi:hypothetical protein